MVKFRSLYNDPNDRQILTVVSTPTGQVTIFEPSKDDVQEIMQMQDMVAAFNQQSEEDNTLDIDGTSILRELIPRLTDLEIDPDMSDEEMSQIIENPSLELLEINSVIQDIVTKIYTLMINNFRGELELQKLVNASEEIGDQTLGMYISEATKTDEGRKTIASINKLSKEVKDKQSNDNETNEEAKAKEKKAFDKNAEILKPDSYENSIKDELANRFKDFQE